MVLVSGCIYRLNCEELFIAVSLNEILMQAPWRWRQREELSNRKNAQIVELCFCWSYRSFNKFWGFFLYLFNRNLILYTVQCDSILVDPVHLPCIRACSVLLNHNDVRYKCELIRILIFLVARIYVTVNTRLHALALLYKIFTVEFYTLLKCPWFL